MGWTGHARDALIERAEQARSVKELFATTSERLRRLLSFDASVWVAVDPATGLPTAPSRVENLAHFGGQDACNRVWELEFQVEDVNRYSDLARSPQPAAGLRLSTGDRPVHSHRYRDLLRPNGFDDELRAVLRIDGRPWALCSLFRAAGRPSFDPGTPGADPGPGLLLFDGDGQLTSINDDAEAWLEELTGDDWQPDIDGVRLPMVVLTTLMRARAITEEREQGTA